MTKSKLMKFSIIILIALTAVFLVMSICQFFIKVNFSGWFVVILLFIFAVTQIICILTGKFSIKKIGFYLVHIGLVAFLLGNFMYFTKGKSIPLYMGIGDGFYSSLKEAESVNELIYLDFAISVDDFTVTKYPGTDVDKWYEAYISIKSGGKIENKILTVNHPVRVKGWKIYLMDYNDTNISVLFKYDPGEYISITGIWMIIIGTFIMCFSKTQKISAGNTPENAPENTRKSTPGNIRRNTGKVGGKL